MITTVDPASGAPLGSYLAHTPEQVQRKVAEASMAWEEWRSTSLEQRAALLDACAGRLEQRRQQDARLMVLEMGKPISEARAEVDKCAWVCRHYAVHGPEHLRPRRVPSDARASYVRHDPLGPLLAVMPWNFPYWQVFRCAAPALMAGNVVLLKHAPNTTGCGMALEELFREAGFPSGCFQQLIISDEQAGQLVDDPRIRAVTLTGSDRAGRAVGQRAGRALKRTVLELGGSDPFVVLGDADVERAAAAAVSSRVVNSGQSCIAAKRFVVHEPVLDRFTRLLVQHMRAVRIGDPMEEETDVGPMAREDLRDELLDQIARSVEDGARRLAGGQPLERPGFYVSPCVMTAVHPEHAVGREETFGPVAAVMAAASEREAVELANATPYGLGASLWTRDLDHAEQLAGAIQAGSVFINEVVKSDPRLPFGGVKRSGIGRELGAEGIRQLTNVKTVWVA